jgi:hypothetical protein
MKHALILLAATAAAGCAVPMPRGYVEVPEARDYEWRGMSSEGVVIGLRIRDHEPEGTLDFWSTVVRKELEGRSGYVLSGEEEVAAKELKGRGLLFDVPGAEPKAYWVALFLTRARFLVFSWDTLSTFEAGGSRDALGKDLPLLKTFLSKLDL